MKNIYICHTVYHLLISIIKGIVNGEKNDILIYKTLPNSMYFIHRMEELKIFNKIILFDCDDSEFSDMCIIANNPIRKYKDGLKRLRKKYDFTCLDDRNIYIFNDNSIVGAYLQMTKKKYRIIEDGLDCYKQIHKVHRFYFGRYVRIKKLFGLGLYSFGSSKYVQSIEINDKMGIDLPVKNKFIEVPRKELFERLTEEQKELILKIFLPKDDIIKEIKGNSTLVITQPLFFDKLVDSEEKQIRIYEDIVQNYSIGKVIIKPHPRDTLNYEKYFKGCVVIKEKYIPLEILNFISGLKIKRTVTAFSTAIQAIDYCDEKICLGMEWAVNHQ